MFATANAQECCRGSATETEYEEVYGTKELGVSGFVRLAGAANQE